MFYPQKCSLAALVFSILFFANFEVRTAGAVNSKDAKASESTRGQADSAITRVVALVDQYLSQGSYLKAETTLGQALKEHPNDFRLTLEQGQLMRTTGRVSRAKALYLNLYQQSPLASEPLIALSQMSLENLAIDDALTYARQAMTLRSNSKSANLALASALIYNNALREANQQLNLVEKKFSRSAEVCYLRYQLLLREDKQKQALAALEEAVKLNPNDARWFMELSNLYKQEGEYNLALETINRYLRLNPNSIEALSKAANLYEYNFHDYDKAILAYQQILKIDPDVVDATVGIDRCRQKGGDLAAALKDQLWKFLRHSNAFQDGRTISQDGKKPPGN